MKRMLLWLLSLALCLSLFPASALAADSTEGSDRVTMEGSSANILQQGGLLPTPGKPLLHSRGTDPYADVKQALYAGMTARAASVDITAYHVPVDDLNEIFTAVINAHPDLFYVYNYYSYSYFPSTNEVTSVSLYYDDSYTDSDVAAFRGVCAQIISLLDPSWDSLEKLLFLHDYLVTHCQYDTSYSRYSAYDALVVGSAVCQGYALAFSDLCSMAGISCSLVTSDELNHAWNLVSINGENFFVDCTWDDPLGWYEGYCAHNNFLLSAAGLYADHTSTDWTNGSVNVYSGLSSSSRYDDAWWRDSDSAIPLIGHLAAWVTADGAYLRDFSSGALTAISLPGDARWPVWGQPGYTWNGSFVSFTARGSLYYFTLPTEIWSLSPDGAVSLVHALSAEESAQGYLFGIVNTGDTLYYSIGTSPYDGAFTRFSLDLPAVSFTVSYDANGGEGAPEPQVKAPGTPLTLSADVPTREGCCFLGWAESASAAAAEYLPGDAYTKDADVTLYAVWEENAPQTCTVTFDANGGTFPNGQTTRTVTVEIGNSLHSSPYPPNSPNDHTVFDYWMLADETPVEDTWSYVPAGDMTLYAHYSECYWVTLDGNGEKFNDYVFSGSNIYGPYTHGSTYRIAVAPGESVCSYFEYYDGYGSVPVYVPEPEDRSLVFTGWYYDPACTLPAAALEEDFTPTENVTLYAGWTKGWYVTWFAGEGELWTGRNVYTEAVPDGEYTTVVPIPEPLDDDMVFLYWNPVWYSFPYKPTANTDFHAQYDYGYEVILDANGGYYGDPSVTTGRLAARRGNSVTPGSISLTLCPGEPDMVLTGWYFDPACTEPAVAPDGEFTPTADVTLYAGWLEPDLVLPASLTAIGDEAFEGGAFRYVKLSDATTAIGRRAFADCPNLAVVSIPATAISIDAHAFDGADGLIIVGFTGSAAEAFAMENGFDFVSAG